MNILNRILKLFPFILFSVPFFSSAQQYNPVANPAAVVQPQKDVRFTVLSPLMIRMEWDSLGHFTDQASFVVVNRKLPVPAFSQEKKDGWLIIHTDSVQLEYKLGSGKFNRNNLYVTYSDKSGKAIDWRPGFVQKENLKGTYRTLDGYDGDMKDGKKIPLEDGILAKDGWTLIDDSHSFLFDNASFPWIDTAAKHSGQDWYILMYGSDYKIALFNYASIGGKVPLPPRFAFGYWWSRYWRYSDNELRNLVSDFRRFNIPVDVLVIDMDWHKQGWTGWTWDSSLFTDPAAFLSWTDREHLKTTLNLHPADGVGPQERQYGSFAEAMNFDTTGHKPVPYIGSDKRFMKTLFDTILHPYEKQGIDFWWLDWQQWPDDKIVNGLSNTWWLNYVFFTEKEKYGTARPMLYHRWGGLGNHRYQIGFSGDVIISWKSLAFQPYFTGTASNVLYDYWSHDIGGHVAPEGFKGINPELYTRWMQYGALSPIFRTHSTKNGLINKEIWEFRGAYFDAIYNAVKFRYSVEPYIYTMARKTYDSAIALCRPLYYDYPGNDNAYKFGNEYEFGDDMLVAPVTEPSDSGVSTKEVWLPAGNDWYEWNTGTLLKGGQILKRQFLIDEYPLYVKAGSIIPMNADTVQNLDYQPATVCLGVFPGTTGHGQLYEDDGNNKNYAKNFSITGYETDYDANGNLVLNILPVKGRFDGMKLYRNYKISFYGNVMPASVIIDGKSLPYRPDDNGNTSYWHYNGKQMSIEVFIPDIEVLKGKKITVHFNKGVSPGNINGLPEKLKRLYLASEKLKYKNAYIVFPFRIAQMEELNRALEYYPDKYARLINSFNNDYKQIPGILKGTKGIDDDDKETFLRDIGF